MEEISEKSFKSIVEDETDYWNIIELYINLDLKLN